MSIKIRSLTQGDRIAILAWFGLAILCLYLAEIINQSIIRNILQQLASIVGITGILTIVLRRQSIIEMVESISEKTNVSKELLLSGICHISNSYESFDFVKEIERCNSSIDINLIYGSRWFKGKLPELIDFAKKQNTELRLCFLNPESSAVSILEKKFNEGPLKSKIEETLDLVSTNFSKHKETSGKVRVFLQNFVPQHTVYRFGDKIYIVPYHLCPGRGKVPIIGFESIGDKKSLFYHFLNDFEELISKHSTEYEIKY